MSAFLCFLNCTFLKNVTNSIPGCALAYLTTIALCPTPPPPTGQVFQGWSLAMFQLVSITLWMFLTGEVILEL